MDTQTLLALGLAQIASEKKQKMEDVNKREKNLQRLNQQLNTALEEKERGDFCEQAGIL